ncbi:MAG: alpha/beta hydrolase-fold protein [Sphingobium sp.]
MRGLNITAMGAAALAAVLVITASVSSASPVPVPFMKDVHTWVVTSKTSHRAYQIWVALPEGYTKRHAPYPVLFAADANVEFGTVVEAARLLAFDKRIPDLIVVGIGYPRPGQGFKASFAERALDFTPSAGEAQLKAVRDFADARGLPTPTAIGGASSFLGFLRGELVPDIEKKYNASHTDRTWFGHSFGGLFGLYALFHDDGLFQRLLIGSPLLNWDDGAIFGVEAHFAKTHSSLPARLYFAVGSEEETPGNHAVSDLQRLSSQMIARNYQQFTLETEVFRGDGHGSVIPLAVGHGLRALYPQADEANAH